LIAIDKTACRGLEFFDDLLPLDVGDRPGSVRFGKEARQKSTFGHWWKSNRAGRRGIRHEASDFQQAPMHIVKQAP